MKRPVEEKWEEQRAVAKANFYARIKQEYAESIDVSETEYKGSQVPSKFRCIKHNEYYWQKPNNLFMGKVGCPHCKTAKKSAASPVRLTQEQYLAACIATHGDRYDYSNTVYVSAHKRVEIGCAVHGKFNQVARLHPMGCGCPKCGAESTSAKQASNKEEFSALASEVHGSVYDYSEGEYRGNLVPYKILCSKHGAFFQTPKDHKRGNGCPKCGCAGPSKPEKEIFDFIAALGYKPESGDRVAISPQELDIYLPEKSLAVEYHGLYFHSDKFVDNNYHLDKLKRCQDNGIDLIQVFEDEWDNLTKREIIKSIIAARLGVCERRIYARNTRIEELKAKEAREFLDDNHLQGFAASEKYYGLKTKTGELVSVMLLTPPRKGITVSKEQYDLELVRFSSLKNAVVIGGFSKLLSKAKGKKIVTYCDRRVFNAKGYEAVGFKKKHCNPPEYYYGKSRSGRLSRLGFQKKHLQNKLEVYDPTKTEHENMVDNGYYRVYGCGTITLTLNCD